MKKNVGFGMIVGTIMVVCAASAVAGDEETAFIRTLSEVSPTTSEAMMSLAAAYTTKCGLAPSVAQMRSMAETDPGFAKALALLAVRAVRMDQMRKDGPIASIPRFDFTEYMQTVAGVMCR
ncbi:MAG: hypothetical protein IDH49_08070 [Gammaproteobacteria bacterium]|nr:hypothetical protein [Gammaproteobacteria bacterium]